MQWGREGHLTPLDLLPPGKWGESLLLGGGSGSMLSQWDSWGMGFWPSGVISPSHPQALRAQSLGCFLWAWCPGRLRAAPP